MLLALWSPKGGSGTSVAAAALALVCATRIETRLADLAGDQPAILGLPPHRYTGPGTPVTLADWLAAGPQAPPQWLDDMAVPVAPGLSLLPGGPATRIAPAATGAALAVTLSDAGPTVIDVGSGTGWSDGAARAVVDVADTTLMVIRPCYLALRRAVADPRLGSSAGVILVEDPGRALDADDVAGVIGLPVVGRFPVRPEIARAVDAGLFPNRLPVPLVTAAGLILDRVADPSNGRWAA